MRFGNDLIQYLLMRIGQRKFGIVNYIAVENKGRSSGRFAQLLQSRDGE